MKRSKKRRMKRDWRLPLVTCILLAVCVYSAVQLVRYAVRSISTRQANAELQDMFEAEKQTKEPEMDEEEAGPLPTLAPEPKILERYQYIGEEIQPKAKELIARNPDAVAWLYVSGGIVDLPVVYRDNTYYLDHNFYGRYSTSGTLFLDEQHPFLEDTQYLVVHGHNWYDGNMFGALTHYLDKEYMEAHSEVYLYTLYRREEYEVVGVLYVPGDIRSKGYVPYVGMRKFQSLDQFYDFAEVIQSHALHWKEGADMRPSEAFLALSTCYEEDRIVVMCRRTDPK